VVLPTDGDAESPDTALHPSPTLHTGPYRSEKWALSRIGVLGGIDTRMCLSECEPEPLSSTAWRSPPHTPTRSDGDSRGRAASPIQRRRPHQLRQIAATCRADAEKTPGSESPGVGKTP
jgi:hypothetical protein